MSLDIFFRGVCRTVWVKAFEYDNLLRAPCVHSFVVSNNLTITSILTHRIPVKVQQKLCQDMVRDKYM
jgi:hypothetical protein